MDRRLHAGPAGLSPRQRAVAIVAVAALLCYFASLHALLVSGAWPALSLVMVLAPWTLVVAPPVLRAVRDGPSMRRVLMLAAVTCALVMAAWLALEFGAMLVARTDAVLYVENVAFFGWLASLFIASLARGREPLVTRMARKTRRGDMPPAVVRYTRHITIAWALFFVGVMTLSTALYFGPSRGAWLLFINVLVWPLVGAAFAIEYVVRITALKNVAHVPFSAAFHAFRVRDHDHRDGDDGDAR